METMIEENSWKGRLEWIYMEMTIEEVNWRGDMEKMIEEHC